MEEERVGGERMEEGGLEWEGERDRPGGTGVKFTQFASVAQGLLVWILGVDMAPLSKPCFGRRPTYKVEEEGHRRQLRASLPQQKKRGLAVDVSSGLIFLKKKKRKSMKRKNGQKACSSISQEEVHMANKDIKIRSNSLTTEVIMKRTVRENHMSISLAK